MEYEIAPELQEEVNGAYAQRFSLELDPLINITLVGPEVILGVARMTPQWLYPSVFSIGAETRDGEWIDFAMPFNPEKYQLRTNKHLANTLNLTNKVNGAVIQFENLDKGTMKAWLKTLETFRKEIYSEVRKIQKSLDTRSRFGQVLAGRLMQFGTWRDKKNISTERKKIRKQLEKIFSDEDEEIADAEEQAIIVEEILYDNAESLPEYKNKTTIKERVRELYRTGQLATEFQHKETWRADVANTFADTSAEEEEPSAATEEPRRGLIWQYLDVKEEPKVRRYVDLSGDEDRFDLETALSNLPPSY